MNIKHIDTNIHKPDLVGVAKAWRQDLAAAIKMHGDKPHASLGGWIVFAPWANMMWSYYVMMLLHLRDVPGMGPPKISNPEATHEIHLWALDPSKVPDLVNPMACRLSPANYVGQFVAPNDEEAVLRFDFTVQEIVHGYLNPDTDARQQWIDRFGSHMLPNRPLQQGAKWTPQHGYNDPSDVKVQDEQHKRRG